MAKSPKKSRRGGRRSPKNSKKTVQKISKDVSEQSPVRPAEIFAAEEVQELAEQPLSPSGKQDLVPTAQEMLTHFFASLTPDMHANAWSLSQLPEQEFLFGKVASMLAANGQFPAEVETNFAVVWKADETWIRSLLAGEVKPPEPEPVPEVEAAMEVAPEEAEAPAEGEDLVENAATVELKIDETKEADVVAQEPLPIPEAPALEEPIAYEPAAISAPQMLVPDKENATQILEDAVAKSPFGNKLGEQSAMHDSAVKGLTPKDVNVPSMDVQPMDMA
jgi:hypothetical protein